ncbi:hypothetical protein BLX24_12265 [Arsenicibacter rosenii]|uniref:DUF3857 domain-containing protein n=1 Tax=Arsenicibacter rosenii TaxID=1750698 RepID=A0A1S2VLQ1_9BACT|nr:hypothetical protein BLX24_12265 [Arsenicibacter rosenii]
MLLAGALSAVAPAWSQDEYKASAIPEPLKVKAHAVVRRSETVYTVKSLGEAVEQTHTIITILDKEGDSHASLRVPYDKLSKVNEIEGVLYDAAGKLIKKLRKNEIVDYSAMDDATLYSDNRMKIAQFPNQRSYPYTVEFTVEQTSRNLMFYPQWAPQADEYLSVEQASFLVDMPKGQALRYKEYNVANPAKIDDQGDRTRYQWSVTNLLPVEEEPFSPDARAFLPMVLTAPTELEVQGYEGKLQTWEDIGRFYYRLNKDRDVIPDELRQQIIQLTASEQTTAGKVAKVYAFLQNQTRYVSVQLGIGGWQTIEAGKVAANKYGDCKALSNYAKAMLKAIHIPAYETIIRAGKQTADIHTDFPGFQFNHVILCVPDGRDTLWLECTSQHNPFGYMGTFTGGRHALLVLPDGGKLVMTPTYKAADNVQHRHIRITLMEDGEAKAEVSSAYTGIQQESYFEAMNYMSQADQRSWVIKRVQIPAFELENYAFKAEPKRIPVVHEKLSLHVRRWGNPSGTRLFVPLNLMSHLPAVTPMDKPRKFALMLGREYEFEDADTITYQLPKGYVPEFMLEPLAIESKFGRYAVAATVKGETLVYTRKVTMHSGRYPAAAYTEWVDFRKKIARADRAQMVFIKK